MRNSQFPNQQHVLHTDVPCSVWCLCIVTEKGNENICQKKKVEQFCWSVVVSGCPGEVQRSEVSVSASAGEQRSQASGCRLISNLTVKQPAGLKSALINPAYWVRLDFALLRLSVCVSAFELTVI